MKDCLTWPYATPCICQCRARSWAQRWRLLPSSAIRTLRKRISRQHDGTMPPAISPSRSLATNPTSPSTGSSGSSWPISSIICAAFSSWTGSARARSDQTGDSTDLLKTRSNAIPGTVNQIAKNLTSRTMRINQGFFDPSMFRLPLLLTAAVETIKI